MNPREMARGRMMARLTVFVGIWLLTSAYASKTFTLYWPGTLADGTQLPAGTYQARGALVFDGFRADPLAANAMGSELETFTVR